MVDPEELRCRTTAPPADDRPPLQSFTMIKYNNKEKSFIKLHTYIISWCAFLLITCTKITVRCQALLNENTNIENSKVFFLVSFLRINYLRRKKKKKKNPKIFKWSELGQRLQPVVSPRTLFLYLVVMCRAGQIGSRSRTRLWAEWSTLCVKSDLADPNC